MSMMKNKSNPVAVLFVSCALFSLAFFSPAVAQTSACQSYTFTNGNTYASCVDLPVLSSFLHWNYTQSTGIAEIAFRQSSSTLTTSRWISWSINPSGQNMIGCQALVAYKYANGTMNAYTSSVTSYGTTLQPGSLSFAVPSINATADSSGEMIIFATLQLAADTVSVTQVWQEGPMASDGQPGQHQMSNANTQSVGTLNLVSSVTVTGGGSNSRQRKRNVHGVLNAVSWGTLMPLGAMIARYLKVFKSADPAWFYLHVLCQGSAYVVGVAGWATGLKLGKDSGADNSVHGNIGLALFIMGTLQAFALLLRPNKDHKFRFYWNIYHHSIGYAVISLSIVNVFKGLDILNPDGGWKKAYIGILISLGVCAAFLEAYTWYIVIKRRKSGSGDRDFAKSDGHQNGYGMGNGRSHVVV